MKNISWNLIKTLFLAGIAAGAFKLWITFFLNTEAPEWALSLVVGALFVLFCKYIKILRRYRGINAQLEEVTNTIGKHLVPAVLAFVNHYTNKTGIFAHQRLASMGETDIFWEAADWGCTCSPIDPTLYERESRERVTTLNNALLGFGWDYWATEVLPPSQLKVDGNFRKEQIRSLWPWTNAKRIIFISGNDFEQEMNIPDRRDNLEDFLLFNSIRGKYKKYKKWKMPRRHIKLRIVVYLDAGPYELSRLAHIACKGPSKLLAHDYAVYGKRTVFMRSNGKMAIQEKDGVSKYCGWFTQLWETGDDNCFESSCKKRDIEIFPCPFAVIKNPENEVVSLVSRIEVIDLDDYKRLCTALNDCPKYQMWKKSSTGTTP